MPYPVTWGVFPKAISVKKTQWAVITLDDEQDVRKLLQRSIAAKFIRNNPLGPASDRAKPGSISPVQKSQQLCILDFSPMLGLATDSRSRL